MDEQTTLDYAIDNGLSICRYGDGCFNIMRGRKELYHDHTPELAYALASYLARPVAGVLNCLPRPIAAVGTLGAARWDAFMHANAGLLPLLGDRLYGSSYLSRMDSAPHCHTEEYWCSIARLWHNKTVTLIAGSEKSITARVLKDSPLPPTSVIQVSVPPRNSWVAIETTIAACKANEPRVVVVSAGTMSRPLVHRLTALGYLVYDVGHLGMYFHNGRPRPLAECPRF